VTRKLFGRQDLERLALQEIRSFAGGEFVISVEIGYQPVDETGANWTLYTFVKKEVARRLSSTRSAGPFRRRLLPPRKSCHPSMQMVEEKGTLTRPEAE